MSFLFVWYDVFLAGLTGSVGVRLIEQTRGRESKFPQFVFPLFCIIQFL